ncbi:39S ribosomal protein L41, mitochondrial [Chrysoperla carnea]|uniref:39S ribosomal protein L41, mitochondrial n=1 Tax=Chrysoperla carnea TaxID=189513 RepID=UPI001D074CE8|nr:39S ribosomal protein L41, mitochondrial [Chrysoperla carnea]
MSCTTINIIKRSISTTCTNYGKRNFRKFLLHNKRGTRIFKESQRLQPDPEIPIDKRGVRDVGYIDEHGQFVTIPEMIPQLIVPDLTDFKLKPYVSYKTADVTQSAFTSEDLFNVVYAPKIKEDFEKNKLNEDGTSKEPSNEELLDADTAKLLARKTGSDIF